MTQTSNTQASVPARIVYTSSVFGTFVEDIAIPLVDENGNWKVNWSPGLIIPQLDDPNGDPNYQRHIRADISVGKRGTIYDNCTTSCGPSDILAEDAPVWQIEVHSAQVANEGTLVQSLSTALALPAAQIKDNYEAPWNCGPSGYKLAATLDSQPTSAQQQTLNAIAGVSINATTERVYPYGADLAAVTGYIAPISSDQLGADKTGYYNQCSLIGDAGVEEWGEQYLRPIQGGALAIYGRNADGTDQATPYYTIINQASANGDDIHTAINLADEQAAVAALKAVPSGKGRGAFAVDPTTGLVLVLASEPACDPNAFAQGNVAISNACATDSTNQPLENYALQAQVPTGSIFKIVTLSTALENGISPTQTYQASGTYQIPGQPTPLTINQGRCQGNVTAPDAIGPSCDLVYYQIGVQLGNINPNLIPNMARAYGFGSAPGVVGIPASEQAAGLVPDPAYYQQQNIGNWAPVDSANLAIGQGDFEANPAQVTMMTQAVADNGVRLQPRLVTAVTNGSQVVTSYPQTQIGTVPVSSTNLAIIQIAMQGTTQSPNGTSYDTFHTLPVLVGGKTGTAQACDNCTTSHAWSTDYGPSSPAGGPAVAPQIAVTALITFSAGSGSGDIFASPVCKAVIAADLHVSG